MSASPFSLPLMFLTFLKIGAILYGSGYVLLAFLHSDFVVRLAWLTNQQLLDAVAIGQVTPGPVFTTATFIGYLLAGVPGALLATLGIFLPAFIFVAISNPLIPKNPQFRLGTRFAGRCQCSLARVDGSGYLDFGTLLYYRPSDDFCRTGVLNSVVEIQGKFNLAYYWRGINRVIGHVIELKMIFSTKDCTKGPLAVLIGSTQS